MTSSTATARRPSMSVRNPGLRSALGESLGESLGEGVTDPVTDQAANVAAIAGNLLDERARDVAELRVAGQEHRLHTGEVTVHEGHRQLVGEVGATPQALDDR